jgi:hypothetical protein
VADALTGDRVHYQTRIADERPSRPVGTVEPVWKVVRGSDRTHALGGADPGAELAGLIQGLENVSVALA